MATNSPLSCNACTILIFCSGATRAYTRTRSTSRSNSGSDRRASSAPVMTVSPGSMMSRRSAMARAVAGWSPVIMTARMPAVRHSCTARAASARGGSSSPTSPMKVRSHSTNSGVSCAGNTSQRRQASASTRRPSAAMRSTVCARSAGSGATPRDTSASRQSGSNDSGAPFTYAMTPPSSRCSVVMRARSESNGSSARRGRRAASSALRKPAASAAR